MSTERDPKIDPMPGDEFQQPGTVKLYVRDVSDKHILLANGITGEEVWTLEKFRGWAQKYANVVRRIDVP